MTNTYKLTIIKRLGLACAALLGIALVLAYVFRDDIFQTIQDPRQPFQTYIKPTAPDYSAADSWLALPDLEQDSFEHETEGDVFVVVPSVYRGGEHWVLPSDDLRRKLKLQKIVRPNYVAPYRSAGRVFAPYYRQASLYTFMTTREDARKAQDFAYQDVRRAFSFFLKHSPPERPLILVGHNQGASHVQRLLADFFPDRSQADNFKTDLKGRLAAAYVIDYPLPLNLFDTTLKGHRPCEADNDVNCIAAFGAFMPNDDVIANRFVSRLLVHDGTDYTPVAGRPLLCINPLLWNRSEDYAPRRLHLGGVAAEGLDPNMQPAPLTKQVGSQCQDGILYVDRPKSTALRRPIKVGGKFRTLPSNLFYEDLRVNAEKRVTALRNHGRLPTRVKKLESLDLIDVIDSPITPVKN